MEKEKNNYTWIDGKRYRITHEQMVNATRYRLTRTRIIEDSYRYNVGWIVYDPEPVKRTRAGRDSAKKRGAGGSRPDERSRPGRKAASDRGAKA